MLLIGNLDSNGRLAWNRCLNTNVRRCKIQLDIISKAYDLADLHAHFWLKLITGDGRSAAYIGYLGIDAEVV